MPDTKNRIRPIALAALFTTLLAACGGDDGGPAATSASPQSKAPAVGSAPSTTDSTGTATAANTATATRSITLTWYPPTLTTDGSPLTNLGGYRVYWGTTAGKYTNSVTVNNAGLSSYVVEELTPARWHFAVTALTTNGAESSYSNEFSTTIQ